MTPGAHTATIFLYVPGKEWVMTTFTGNELDIKKAAVKLAATHGKGKWTEIRVYVDPPALLGRRGTIVWADR